MTQHDAAAKALKATLEQNSFTLPYNTSYVVVASEIPETLEIQAQPTRKLSSQEWVDVNDAQALAPEIFLHQGVEYDVDIGQVPS